MPTSTRTTNINSFKAKTVNTDSFNTDSFNTNSFNTTYVLGEAALVDLPYAGGASYDPAKACLEGTRTELVQSIFDWVNDPASPSMLWLYGVAGSGKEPSRTA